MSHNININRFNTKIVMLLITEMCNLNCHYCFEHNKSLNKMSFETAKSIIDNEIAIDDDRDVIEIELFGGEPFLEFELIKKLVKYVRTIKTDKKVYFFATTNGVLIKDDIKRWLVDNKDLVVCSVSLDGTPEMHNLNRDNSFDKIDYSFFKELYPEQTCKMTISELTLPKIFDGIMFLIGLGYKIKASFAQGINWDLPRNVEILENELKKLVDYYIRNPNEPLITFLDYNLVRLSVAQTDDNFRWCGAGKGMIAYDYKGDSYPCQSFSPFSLGESSRAFKNKIEVFKNFRDPKCKGCFIERICPTCYGINQQARGDYKCRDGSLCTINKMCVLASANIQFHRLQQITDLKSECLSGEQILCLKAIKDLNRLLVLSMK